MKMPRTLRLLYVEQSLGSHRLAALLTLALSASIAQAQNASSVELIRISDRAFACEDFKLAELYAMPRDKLEETYCSYEVSAKLSSKQEAEARAKYAHAPQILDPMLALSSRLRNQCVRGMQKTLDLFSRKFMSPAPDCKLMWDLVKAAADEHKGGRY